MGREWTRKSIEELVDEEYAYLVKTGQIASGDNMSHVPIVYPSFTVSSVQPHYITAHLFLTKKSLGTYTSWNAYPKSGYDSTDGFMGFKVESTSPLTNDVAAPVYYPVMYNFSCRADRGSWRNQIQIPGYYNNPSDWIRFYFSQYDGSPHDQNTPPFPNPNYNMQVKTMYTVDRPNQKIKIYDNIPYIAWAVDVMSTVPIMYLFARASSQDEADAIRNIYSNFYLSYNYLTTFILSDETISAIVGEPDFTIEHVDLEF